MVTSELALAFSYPTGQIVELEASNTGWLQLLNTFHTVDQRVGEAADATGSDVAVVRSADHQIVYGLWAWVIRGPIATQPT